MMNRVSLEMIVGNTTCGSLRWNGRATDRGKVRLRQDFFRNSAREAARCLVWLVLLSVASYVVASHFVVESVKVVGSSMYPTLCDSQHALLDRFSYIWRAPRRGEVVVVVDPLDGRLSIKRIVALPGEEVGFSNGHMLVNNSFLQEDYLPKGTVTFPTRKDRPTSVRCGKDEYFVLGDNRATSIDSRDYGPVRRANIIGLVKL